MKTIGNIIPATIIVAFASTMAVFASVPSRYFIGRFEVSESFFNSVPDSLRDAKGIWISDSLVVESFELPITHKIDSVSATGKKLLVKRPDNEITMIRQALGIAIQKSANDDFKVNEGERIMDSVTLEKLSDNKIIGCFIENGICYLLSFWATWCGNCLIELQEEYIPNAVAEFKDLDDFKFAAICIDSSNDELDAFFKSNKGRNWMHIYEYTYIDQERKANELFSKGGIMPLNVVIGKDGRIRYIHSGKLTDEVNLNELRQAIVSGLQ